MKGLKNLYERASDRGVALPFIAILLVLLIGMAAFAVDLGWLYLNGSKVQRAADSAALAGVVYLPGDTGGVNTHTVNGAQANGYNVGTVNGSPTGGGGPDALSWQAVEDNKLYVNLESSVETFFLKVLGFSTFDIQRDATAEYVKPVPLGSPDPCFGIGSTGIQGQDCNPATAQRFWAAISGRYTNKFNGDAYTTRWWSSSGWSPPDNVNTENRTSGYYLAVDVPAGVSDIDIDIYDAGFYDRGSFDFQTGDRFQDSGGGTHTHFQVYYPDITPLDPTDNTAIPGCRFDINSGASASTYRNQWRQLCSVNPTQGIYVVRVWVTGNLGGTNQYGVRATTNTVTSARVYGINDISIFTNQSGISTLHVAEVIEDHAGKTLELEFYDPGEDDQNAYMTVLTPSGATAQCTWEATNEAGSVIRSGSGNCRIQTSNGNSLFNGLWVKAEIDISTTYTCGTDCWWRMRIENSQPHDRTTWKARIIGNPVRLTPNA